MNFAKRGVALAAVLLAVVGTASISAASEDRSVRIDLNGEGQAVALRVNATSPGAQAKNSEWRKDKAPYWVTALFPSRSEAWSEGSLTFTPSISGRVVVMLKGPYVRQTPAGGARPVWVYFDDLRSTGAKLVNPGFEEIQAGRPTGWYRPPPPAGATLPPELTADIDTTQPAEGKARARVWHNSFDSQAIEVTAGQPVTLVFRHRLYE